LVVPFNFVGAYLTFPKVIVLIFRRATTLRLSLLPEPALIQADQDYQNSDVDQKIRQFISTCQGPSAELDKDFIMGIEIGSSILLSVQSKANFSNFRCDKCACIRGIVWLQLFLELVFSHMTLSCWCKGSVGHLCS